MKGKVFKQPTYKEYTRNVFKPGQEAQCRNAAQADGLAVYQLPQDVLPELKVIAAIIYITRVYCSMIFHSVKQHKTPKKETLLARSGCHLYTRPGIRFSGKYVWGASVPDIPPDIAVPPPSLRSPIPPPSPPSPSQGCNPYPFWVLVQHIIMSRRFLRVAITRLCPVFPVDEHKAVLTKYFTRLLPVLRNLMDRPLNALASIINDPVNQREMIGEEEEQQMLIEPAQQAAPPQAPHTDFKPVAADQDDGLVFLLACQDFDLVAYMYSHLLMEQAAPYYKNGKPDLHSLGAVAAHAVLREGTLVKVKAGQLVLFRGNTVHAGTAGRPDSCGARLYGFAKTGQPADNTTVNVSQLGPVFEGVFQPTQGGTITSMTAEWNRRGQAGQMDPVVMCQDPVSQDPVDVQQDPVAWCQDPVGVQQDPVGVQQDPVGKQQDPVGQDPEARCQDPVGQDPVVCCQDPDPVVWCQDPVVWCQDPVGQEPVVWCQDPVVWCQDPVGQEPVVWCQVPVVWCQDPVGQNPVDPVVWCQDPVVWCQDPVVWCQDPVGQNPVDPVGQNPVVRRQDPVVWCQDPVAGTEVFTKPIHAWNFPINMKGKVFKQPTYKEYTRNVFKPGQEAQCRNAAQADGLAVYQLPQDVLPELKVIAAIIYITRVYCSMIFHSVKQHKTPKKETLLARSGCHLYTRPGIRFSGKYVWGASVPDIPPDIAVPPPSLRSPIPPPSPPSPSQGCNPYPFWVLVQHIIMSRRFLRVAITRLCPVFPVDEHKAVLTKYFTRLLPVLRNLMDRPLNALASIINDPVNQREMIGEEEEQQMLIEPAQQAAPPQAPHTDFKPVAADQDDGLVFLLACQDFDLVAYMYSHLLMEQAAPYYKNGKPDLHSLGAVAAHAVLREGTLVKVKAGQLVLFRGNTVHAGTAGRPDSCGARLYGFAKTGQPADNTTVNVSQLGPVFEGVFQPTQGGTITSMTAEWNRRGQAGQMDPVVMCQDPVSQDPVDVQQDPVAWCQDPVGVQQDPVGVQQDPMGKQQDPVGQDPEARCQDPVGQDPVVCCQDPDPVVWCQDPVVWCQDPVGQEPVVWCQDPVVWCQDPVGQEPVVWCQVPVVWCQDPVGQNPVDPVVWCQDPVVWCQDPVVWCQDPVGQNPVDPVGQNPVVRRQDPVVWCQDPVVRYQDPVVPGPCGMTVEELKHLSQKLGVGSVGKNRRQLLERIAEYCKQ
ncbi:hypothetical protein V8C86DRAFT_3036018 [Haematococcus lacustris]